MNEKLSALLDDELSEHEREALLRQMGRDPQLRGTWERYHVIRGVLRREMGTLASPGLADRIRERTATESPAHSGARRPLFARPAFRAASALAIAASVAAIAILTVRPSLTPEVAPRTTASVPSRSPQSVAAASARDSTLNAMLVKHSEFSPAVGMNGLASYVRVVGHSLDRDNGDQ